MRQKRALFSRTVAASSARRPANCRQCFYCSSEKDEAINFRGARATFAEFVEGNANDKDLIAALSNIGR